MSGAVVIAGNNLAAMVAAQSIAASGREVTLVNPAPFWGGHFAGLELESRRFDPGMVLYEFSAFNSEEAPDVRSYDPERRNDCGRFTRVVRDYVERRVPTVAAPDPSMLIGGRLLPDLVIGNHIESLAMLAGDTRDRVRAELEEICASGTGPLHASHKARDKRFASTDFATVSLANHGRTLHETVFEPVCRKILGVSCRDILALYHRVAWLPLYYPETLLSQFGATPQHLPATQFHCPAEGSAGALVRALAQEVETHPGIRILRTAIRMIRTGTPAILELADGGTVTTADFVWALDPGALMASADVQAPHAEHARASIGLCFIALAAEQLKFPLSSSFVIDAERAIYRVTDQDACAGTGAPEHRLVAEFSPSSLASRGITDAAGQQQALLLELAELGLIGAPQSVAYCSVKTLKNALMIPNSVNRDLFRRQQDWLHRHFPAIHLAGPSAGFAAAAMNDQIVQGLKLGAQLGNAA